MKTELEPVSAFGQPIGGIHPLYVPELLSIPAVRYAAIRGNGPAGVHDIHDPRGLPAVVALVVKSAQREAAELLLDIAQDETARLSADQWERVGKLLKAAGLYDGDGRPRRT